MKSSFGVYIGAYPGDFWMAKGCVASIRRHYPDVPICLLWDADRLPNYHFRKQYNLSCLRPRDIQDPQLRELSAGQGGLKMAIFWEGPFDQFCYLDGDTVLTRPFDEQAFKFRKDRPFTVNGPGHLSEADVNEWFFDTSTVNRWWPDLEWQGFPFFNSGIYFGNRNSFPMDEYLRLRKYQKEHPEWFFVGDQGLLNILAAAAVQRGEMRVESRPLQEMITSSIPGSGEAPLIHWCGPKKPSLDSSLAHVNEMTEARLSCAEAVSRLPFKSRGLLMSLLRMEDCLFVRQPEPGTWHYPYRWRLHRLMLKLKPLYL